MSSILFAFITLFKLYLKGKSKWEPRPKASHKTFPDDHIETYLLEPVISPKVMDDVGGYISYWTSRSKSCPNLARMALDHVSAPGKPVLCIFIHILNFISATSVDAERAFSTGCRQVSFMQHNMTSQTFKACMGVGSWAKTPLLPSFEILAEMLTKGDVDPAYNKNNKDQDDK